MKLKIPKNVMLSCVYRTPGTNVTTFNEKMEEMLNKMGTEKVKIVCGDFNIDLVNPLELKTTTEFINTMYSHCL